jgi:sugar phosphate isomerase/epimerase
LKFSISNIAWPSEWDELIWTELQSLNYQGIEIAPLRTFEAGYNVSQIELDTYLNRLHQHHLSILSMQSLISNFEGSIFESEESMNRGLAQLENALSFSQRAHIPNVVFGSPRNRNLVHEGSSQVAEQFFKHAANLAQHYHVRIALEANPTIYQTNFINYSAEALDFVKSFNHPALGINLDLGTMINNHETIINVIQEDTLPYIFHVHISEPFLKLIDTQRMTWHREVLQALSKLKYDKTISIEMSPGLSYEEIIGILKYVATLREDVYAQ